MNLHDCCKEYAENCVSCSLHENIRQDERFLIAKILTKKVTWHNQDLRNKVIDLAIKGSSGNKRKIVEYSTIEIDNDSAYIWVGKEEIKPPIKTISEVGCNIDLGADNKVIGVEILGWPKEKIEEGS